jgi:hypothetical protein
MNHVYRKMSFDLSDEIVIIDSCLVAIRERYFADVFEVVTPCLTIL